MPNCVIDAHNALYPKHTDAQLLKMNPEDEESFNYIINKQDMHNHQYILGASGSGKSELIKLLFVNQVIELQSSIVIIDPHGDLALQCARMISDKECLVYIDPSLRNGITPTINPFRLRKADEVSISIMAQELVYALESIIGTDFSPNMEVVLIPCIYTLLRKGNSGLDELLKFMDDDDNSELIKLGQQSPIKIHSDFFNKQFSKAKFTTTKNAIETRLQLLLNNPIFSNFITGDSTVNLEKNINTKGKVIVFRLPKDKMRKTLEPAAKFIIALIQGIVLNRANKPQSLRPRTYLILDEFQNFYSKTLEEMLSESRKNNLTVLCVHQALSQVDTKMRDMIMSNAYVKIVGNCSAKDLAVMSNEIEVDIESLKQLKIGEFYIKAGSNSAINIATTNEYLRDKNSISEVQWKLHLKYQRKKYYKEVINTAIGEIITDTIVDDTHSLSTPKYNAGER